MPEYVVWKAINECLLARQSMLVSISCTLPGTLTGHQPLTEGEKNGISGGTFVTNYAAFLFVRLCLRKEMQG